MFKCEYTSAILHVGLFAPNRPIGELCTNGKFVGALDLLIRFLNSSLLCPPKNAAFGLNACRIREVREKREYVVGGGGSVMIF